jgi:hypothetical protein
MNSHSLLELFTLWNHTKGQLQSQLGFEIFMKGFQIFRRHLLLGPSYYQALFVGLRRFWDNVEMDVRYMLTVELIYIQVSLIDLDAHLMGNDTVILQNVVVCSAGGDRDLLRNRHCFR